MREISVKWKNKNEIRSRRWKLDHLYETMKGYQKGFPDDNQYASIFVKLLPQINQVFIDYDRNEDLQVPEIHYAKINYERGTVPVPRTHTLIWDTWEKITEIPMRRCQAQVNKKVGN